MPKNSPILVVSPVAADFLETLRAVADSARVEFVVDPAVARAATADVLLLPGSGEQTTANLPPKRGQRRTATVMLQDQTSAAGPLPTGTGILCLPPDTSPRQLVLICELLGRNVRLRRRLARGRRQRQRLSSAALTDPLTRLPNRRAWQHALKRVARQGTPEKYSVLVLFDLDRFKLVNDERGHAAGDRTLASAAAAIRQSVRDSDFVARLGGDEFGVLLSAVETPSAATVVERVRRQAQSILQGVGESITMSAGFSPLWQQREESCRAPFDLASAALSDAKKAGRDRTAGPGASSESGRRGEGEAPAEPRAQP